MTDNNLRLLEPLPFEYTPHAAHQLKLTNILDEEFTDNLEAAYQEYSTATNTQEIALSDPYAGQLVLESYNTKVCISAHEGSLSLNRTGGEKYPFDHMSSVYMTFQCRHDSVIACDYCLNISELKWWGDLNLEQRRQLMHKVNFSANGDLDPLLRQLSYYRVITLLFVSNFKGREVMAPLVFWPEGVDTVHVCTILSPPGTDAAFPVYVNTYNRLAITAGVLRGDIVNATIAADELTPFNWMCQGCYQSSMNERYDNKDRYATITGYLCRECVKEEIRMGVTSTGAIPEVS